MRVLFLSRMIVLMAMVAGSLKLQASTSYIAMGSLRGYMESCGCSPETDYGGLRRLAHFVSFYRSLDDELLLFNLGDNLGADKEKNSYIVDSLIALAPSVSLPETGAQAHAFKARFKQMKHVLSVGKKPDHIEASPVYHLGNYAVFGVIAPLMAGDLDALRGLVKKNKSQKSILLFRGDQASLERLLKENLFTTIISSNHRQHQVPDLVEIERPGTLLRLEQASAVPSFGQGVLVFNLKEKKSILFGDPGLDGQEQQPFLALASPYRWLSAKWQRGPRTKLDAVMDRYDQSQNLGFAKLIESWEKENKAHYFVGSHVCKACHKSEFETWRLSKHSRAYETLQRQGKEMTAECVKCHVVGFDQGAFRGIEQSPHLAGVGCENCHGPAKLHLSDPTAHKPKANMEVCHKCHHPPHVADFSFSDYWPSIKH